MTTFLLDVNVLIALIDPAHLQHDKAHDWFGKVGQRAWATCPITQNGVIRIVGHPRYPGSPGTPAGVAALMKTLSTHPGHAFWADTSTLLNEELVHSDRLLDSSQVTDSYLLALAVSRSGKLATFDRQLVTSAVSSGSQALHVIS